jgi:hypothetical protein
MRQPDVNQSTDPTIMGNDRPRQDPDAPEGKEGAGAHREGPHSKQSGHEDRRGQSQRPADRDQATHGPDDRHGETRDSM